MISPTSSESSRTRTHERLMGEKVIINISPRLERFCRQRSQTIFQECEEMLRRVDGRWHWRQNKSRKYQCPYDRCSEASNAIASVNFHSLSARLQFSTHRAWRSGRGSSLAGNSQGIRQVLAIRYRSYWFASTHAPPLSQY